MKRPLKPFSLFLITLPITVLIRLSCNEVSLIPSAIAFSTSRHASSRRSRFPTNVMANSKGKRSYHETQYDNQGEQRRPIPAMPSELFQQLALSQLELLANSMPCPSALDKEGKTKSKIKSIALYLPQENVNTGQLEFLPAVIYPHPSTERVFIASGADTGVAPTLPKLLTKLPGFAAPNLLLPRYPMVSTSRNRQSEDELASVGVVEEVLCDLRSGVAALSVPLFLGSQTVGVLLVSPEISNTSKSTKEIWTKEDREQIARAAQTLSMALNMDMERNNLEIQSQRVQNALSDSLHQVKNPLQALRTFGKLLQRRVASTGENAELGTTLQLLELTQNLMEQSDRVVNLLAPMDSLVDSLNQGKSNRTQRQPLLYLNPAKTAPGTTEKTIQLLLPWESDTLEFARREASQKSMSTLSITGTRNSHNNNHDEESKNLTMEFGRPGTEERNRPTTAKSNLTSSPATSSSLVVGDDDELEMTFILDVLDPILSAYKAIGEERGISFEIIGLEDTDELPGVMIRRKAFHEAFSNILDNAFKYVVLSPPKQKLSDNHLNPKSRVRVRILPNDVFELPAGVTIFVEDNGPGVPSNEIEAVFERGFRSPSISSFAQGSGIGLDISLALIENMGGQLTCLGKEARNVVGNDFFVGAVFQLTLFRDSK